MRVEIFYSAGCERCATDLEGLQAAARQVVSELVWREINVLEEIDYAVELGVLTLPAIAVDGELIFGALPSAGQLREALTQRAKRKA